MGRPRGPHGDGSVTQLENGLWLARVPMGLDPATGRRARPSKTFPTKRQANEWRREKVAERDRGDSADDGGRTLGAWLTEWLAAHKESVEESTYAHDEFRAERWVRPALAHVPLGEMTPTHVRAVFASMTGQDASDSEKHKAGRVLRACLTQAVREGLIKSNPAMAVKLPKTKQKYMKPLTREEAARLASVAAGLRNGAYILVALETGMRPGEVTALHWPEFDPDAPSLTVKYSVREVGGKILGLKSPKTNSSRRTLPISGKLAAAIQEHRRYVASRGFDAEKGLIFPNAKGGLFQSGNLTNNLFGPALERAKCPKVCRYDLRHTFATLLLQDGVNLKVVSRYLGHENVATTLKFYAHVMPGDLESANARMASILRPVPE